MILDAFFRSLTQEAEKTGGFVRVVAREDVMRRERRIDQSCS